jgi:anti-sigma B factor antagonist
MVVENEGNKAVVQLPEKLVGKTVQEMMVTVREIQEKGATHVTLDFKATTFLDSSAVGSLVSLTKSFKTKGTVLSLRGLNDDIKSLFAETGLEMIFNIETGTGVDTATVDLFETSVDIRLDIKQEVDGDICIFHLSGVMNHPVGSRYFKQQFLLAMVHHHKILLDFENLTFFDSLSVSVVLNMNKLLRETGGSMRLCAANYIVDDLFSTLNIGQIVPIFDDIAQAKIDWT